MKKCIFLCILSISLMFCGTKMVKVTGVVTYFNEALGQKPDVGAKIYFLNISELNEDDMDSLRSFCTSWCYTKYSPSHLKNTAKVRKWELDPFVNNDSLLKVDLAEAIDREIAVEYFKDLMRSTNGEDLICTANGSGEFNINLPAGRYSILVEFFNKRTILIDRFQDIQLDQYLPYDFKKSDL